ncbi:LysR substrate-binding domain-containing protein [Variovorax sp. JS1663]|uniref:LysR substrate-binding domain-containing protein n=1 Tax=Variovorax sp. JS1663 TaxID=1851577 RepID=UPI000B3419F1|nr:LysR substrate-binding domain-containing protein [Variovorax sp. JS1663]
MKTTLEELQAFTAVVDTGSVTAAAERLDQTVSGISRALGRLEKKLGTTLLRRTTRRIELTEEGQAFLTHARAILAAIDSAEEQMALRRQQPAGRLRVNAATPFMLHAIVPLVAAFRAAYPQIDLELDTDELNIDLLERRTDIAIRIGALRDSTLHARPLGTSRIRVLASPAYLVRHGRPRSVAGLAKHLLLGFTQPESLNRWPLRGAHGDEWPIKPAITASSGETLRRLALEGAGIVCLSDFMTAGDRARGDLVQLLARDTVEVRQPINAVYYRNTALAARVTCFLDFIAGRLGGWDLSRRTTDSSTAPARTAGGALNEGKIRETHETPTPS